MHSINKEQKRFDKNAKLEGLLSRLNAVLGEAEASIDSAGDMAHPLIIVVGAPRSGTTFMMQWLGSVGSVVIPTNLMSRFYKAPEVGLMVQKLLTDPKYQYRDEIPIVAEPPKEFRSDLGKTAGMLNHNSFFYFWRQFIDGLGLAAMSAEQRREFDGEGLRAAVSQIVAEAGKPFAIKGLLIQYDLDLIASFLRKVLIIHIVRDPVANMRSLLKARESVHGTKTKWWSTRPPGSEKIMALDPALQVAWQVRLCNEHIARQLGNLSHGESLPVEYEELCSNPAAVWQRIAGGLEVLGEEKGSVASYRGATSFKPSKGVGLASEEIERLQEAWESVTETQ